MVRFQSFLSSSSGNSTFVTDGTTNILIDCGASLSYTEKCLSRITDDKPSAILLTHAHHDHIAGAGALSKKYDIPVYATENTFLQGKKSPVKISDKNIRTVLPNDDIIIEELKIHTFSIPHDAKGAISYTVSDGESKFGIATDLGHINDEILDNLKGCRAVIAEANHDINMLKTGPYPYYLKNRILGDNGHLSNEACAHLCLLLAQNGTKEFWLGHLSEHNNLPSLAYLAVRTHFLNNGINIGTDVSLNVLPKYWIGENE